MNHAETETRPDQVAEYLESMRSLQSEMAFAIESIVSGALPDLQQSIRRQEELCAQLVPLAKAVRQRGTSSLAELQIDSASASLQKKNLEYAALLRRSGRTVSLLSSLCHTHTGQMQEARGSRRKYQTWSCEM